MPKGHNYLFYQNDLQRCTGLSIDKKNIEQTSVPKYTFPLWVLQEAVSERDITI